VDAGETARTSEPGWFPRWQPYFRLAVRFEVRPEEEIGPRMRALGLDPGDVRHVVLTHLHTDHVAGVGEFTNAEVIAGRADWDLAQGFAGKTRGYLPHRWPSHIEPRLVDLPAEPHGPFERSMEVASGVRIVATPGHSPRHQSVLVEDGETRLLLAGDTSYDQQCMLDGAVDGVSPDAETALDTLRRIREACREAPTVYLPSHDPESVARLEARQPVPA